MARIQLLCESIRQQIDENLSDVAMGQDTILEDVLSNTQQATQILRLLSSRMVTPILRSSPSDRLCLKFISWLHSQHPMTTELPSAFTDGDCAMWPYLDICPIYFFPAAEQRVLLYLPLYFHEFGHLLYRLHKEELDALVRDLQQDVDEVLRPSSQRNDRHAVWQSSQRELIVTTWYKWIQELFCDSVGLTLGGPAFLWAFSTYLSTLDRGDFYYTPTELGKSEHPTSLLRLRMLTTRASNLGLSAVAKAAMEEWETIAATMGVVEDYHGFYDDELSVPIHRAIDDMLTEVEPRAFSKDEINASPEQVTPDESPVSLVHKAWSVFLSSQQTEYSAWEYDAIKCWLGSERRQ